MKKPLIIIQSSAIQIEALLEQIAKRVSPTSSALPEATLADAAYTVTICETKEVWSKVSSDGLSENAVIVLASKFKDNQKTRPLLTMLEKMKDRTVIYTGDASFMTIADEYGFEWFVKKPATSMEISKMAEKIVSLFN